MATVTGDRELTARDVLALSSADAVAALFATLGWDTAARVPQSPAAMGITAESLRRKVRRIERLADQDSGELQVYLVELDSVTIAAITALARTLRTSQGRYLLVLTSDYDELDFVLVELRRRETTSTNLAIPSVSVHTRRLTVQRRNPSSVALRG